MRPPDPNQPVLARCDSVNVALAASGARMQGGKVSMSEFVRMLSSVLDRTVIDKTGLTGHYDFTADWSNDQAGPAMMDSRGPTR